MSSEQSDLSLENLQNMCDNKGFKNKFYKELTVFYESVSSSLKKPWTRNRLQEVIECIKQSRVALGAGVRRTPMQYYWSTKYDVLKIDNEDCLILKKKKPEEPSIRVVAVEDYFDILFKIHEENGHSGRDKIKKIIKDKYYIPRKPVEIFVYLCPTCDNKRGFLKKSVISSSKAIVSEGLNSRGHVDVIDFVSAQDGEYKYLLSYQDKVTKFIQLRPLVTKQPLEIAMELVKIFGIFGAPLVLQSDNSREFTANIVKEVVKLWPVCKILHGSPEPTTSNIKTNEDIKYAIYNWMRENYSTKWSIGCYFVQYDRNASTDVTLGTSPYRTLFRRDPKIGLRSLNIPEDILKLVDSEEELAISVQINEATSSLQAPDDTASSWQWEETDAVNLQPAEQSQASGTGPPVEENFCDACNTGFTGFLYLCGQCDYQMCTSCDYAGAHKDHYVLRVPAHSPKAEVDEVLGKFRATLDAMTLKRPPPNRRKKKKRKELAPAPAPAPGSDTDDADEGADEGDARATETPVDVVVKMEVEVEEHDPLGAARVKREPAAPDAPAAANSFTEMEEVTIKMEPIDEVECPSTSQFPSIHLGDPRAPNDHCESTDPRAPNDPCESTDPSDVQKVPTASGPLKRGMKQTSAPNISKKPRGKKSKAVT